MKTERRFDEGYQPRKKPSATVRYGKATFREVCKTFAEAEAHAAKLQPGSPEASEADRILKECQRTIFKAVRSIAKVGFA